MAEEVRAAVRAFFTTKPVGKGTARPRRGREDRRAVRRLDRGRYRLGTGTTFSIGLPTAAAA
jgi:hypothetical protein